MQLSARNTIFCPRRSDLIVSKDLVGRECQGCNAQLAISTMKTIAFCAHNVRSCRNALDRECLVHYFQLPRSNDDSSADSIVFGSVDSCYDCRLVESGIVPRPLTRSSDLGVPSRICVTSL